jgi:drug/metabolite transporter (DMT)-like permease
LLAALSFALGSVLQQRGTLGTEAPEGDPHFLAEIVREPVWLAGAGCQALGWILQAAALARTTLVVTQSLCALSLVFALPLGVRLTDQRVDRRAVVGAVVALGGIVTFVTLGEPAGGITEPAAAAWWTSAAASLAGVAVLARVAVSRRGAVAAALLACAAGVCFAYQAAVTKTFVTELGSGVGPLLTTWSTYALIATALGGFALQQSALKTGYLAPALAASNASTLLLSVVMGVWIFEETLAGGGHGVAAVGALAAAVVGVVLLATPTRPPAPAHSGDHPLDDVSTPE